MMELCKTSIVQNGNQAYYKTTHDRRRNGKQHPEKISMIATVLLSTSSNSYPCSLFFREMFLSEMYVKDKTRPRVNPNLYSINTDDEDDELEMGDSQNRPSKETKSKRQGL